MPVPAGVWTCDDCDACNIIANAPDVRPLCSHTRDHGQGCYSDIDEAISTLIGLFPGYPGHQLPYNDLWTCEECGTENHDWCDICPCGATRSSVGFTAAGFMQRPGAGSPAGNSWECPECGHPNSKDLDVACANCGASRPED